MLCVMYVANAVCNTVHNAVCDVCIMCGITYVMLCILCNVTCIAVCNAACDSM